MPHAFLEYGNDMLLKVTGLQSDAGSIYDTASVYVTLFDVNCAQVTGQSWPTNLAADTTSGDYVATLVDSLILTVGSGNIYKAVVHADAGAGLHKRWDLELHARLNEG